MNIKIMLLPLALSLVVLAQADRDTTSGITLRGGYSYLADSNAGKLSSPSGYTFGAGWDLKSKSYAWMGVLSLDFDYAIHNANSHKLESWGLELDARQPFGKYLTTSTTPHFYYGLGVGIFRVTAENDFPVAGGGTVTSSETQYVLGGTLLLGVKLTAMTDFELAYRVRANVNGINANTLNLTFGVHF